MKWTPFGKDSESFVEGHRDGCANQPCIHLKFDIATSTDEARKAIRAIESAIKYAEGRKRRYKDDSHNWHPNPNYLMNKKEIIEMLAEVEHNQWLVWSQSLAERNLVGRETMDKWLPLWVAYKDLSELQKEKDRAFARVVYKVIRPYLNISHCDIPE